MTAARLLPLLTSTLLLLATIVEAGEEPRGWLDERSRTFQAVIDVFDRHYWDPDYRDWHAWGESFRQRALAADSREAFDLVLVQMVSSLGDEHSAWLGKVAVAGDQEIGHEDDSRFGFQARLLPLVGLVVERVYPGSAAARSGLERGDVIISVAGRDLARTSSNQGVWQLLATASEQDKVEFAVQRGNRQLRIELAPTPFEIERARDMPQAQMLADGLGYLYVPSFNRFEIGEQVHGLLTELQGQGLSQLILDLRGNPGGRIGELGLTLGAFMEGSWARAISRGELVWQGHYEVRDGLGTAWLEDPNGRVLLRRFVDNPTRFEGPLAVLVDASNSSAGELAALVLQDLGLARIVGESTGGNVEAVQGFDLPDGSVVLVAVANVEGVSGRDFSMGVEPDVPAQEDLRELAKGYDAPLAQAIRLLRELPFTPDRYFGGVAAE